MISNELGKPFFPIRKKGKLPGSVSSITYTLEYGEVNIILFVHFYKFEHKVFLSATNNNIYFVDAG